MQIQMYSFNGSVVCRRLVSFLVTLFVLCSFKAYSQNVGIGTTSPTANLHVNGSFRLSNGSEGPGKVLTSDASGKANWAAMPTSVPTGDENVNGYGDWLGCEAENITAYQPFIGSQGHTFFGYAMEMTENFTFVGAPSYDTLGHVNTGIVIVYELIGNSWVEKQRLIDPTGGGGDNFGITLASDGTTLVVGSPVDSVGGFVNAGSACVFEYDGTSWQFLEKITMAFPANYTVFGNSVDVLGDYMVIGAFNYATVGRAFVYFRIGSDWQYLMDIPNPVGTANDNFGKAVAISEDAIAIGADGYDVDSLNCGSVFIYKKISGSFYFAQQLIADHYGFYRSRDAYFGNSLELDGHRLIICVPQHKRSNKIVGAAAYYTYDGNEFVYKSTIYNDSGLEPAYYGAVNLSGPYFMVNSYTISSPGQLGEGKYNMYKLDDYGGIKIAEVSDPSDGGPNGYNSAAAVNHITKRFVLGNSVIYNLRGKIAFGKIKI